jgi:hypothetical protein
LIRSHDQARPEAERLVGKWLYYDTINMTSKGRRIGKNGDSSVFGHKVDSLLCREGVVSILQRDCFKSRSLQDRVVHEWLNLPCEQNPLIVSEISEHQTFFVTGGMVF